MTVNIPVKVAYTGDALNQLKDEAKKVDNSRKNTAKTEQQIVKETREQIKNHKIVLRLTKQLNKELDEENKKRKSLSSSIGSGVVRGAAAIGVANFTSDFIKDSARMADEASKVETAFQNLSMGAGGYIGNLEAMGEATRGRVSELDQQRIANQLLGMRIVANSEELERTVSISRRLGKEFRGLGTREAAEEFAIMASNMSFARLDSFGISSGRVRKRVDELTKSVEGMTKEEAFLQAALEEGEATLSRLGPEVETVSDRYQDFVASTQDLQTEFGKLLVTGGDGGVLGMLDSLAESLTEGAIAWQGTFKTIGDITEAQARLETQVEETDKTLQDQYNTWVDGIPVIGGSIKAMRDWVQGMDNAISGNTEFAESYQEVIAEQEEASAAIERNTRAVFDNSESLAEAAERAEKFAVTSKSFAMDILEIEETLGDDLKDARDDWLEENAQNLKEGLENEADIWDDYADSIDKINKKLGKSITKGNRDTAKDIAKVDKQLTKDIQKAKDDARKESENKTKKEQLDALADERLFQFNLRQLAAEGDAAAIAQALERQEIEQQIESEKAEQEKQIQANKELENINELKNAAQERKDELRADNRERIEELTQAAREEREAAKAERDEALEDERLASVERVQLAKDTRLGRIKEARLAKDEAIAELAEQYIVMGDLTNTELSKLATIAKRQGEATGEAFVKGMKSGVEKEGILESLLGSNVGAISGPTSSVFGTSQDQFTTGGSFIVGGSGGPDSQRVAFDASPGERVTISPTINQTINGDGAAQIAQMIAAQMPMLVEGMLQEYTDTILAEVLQ